MYDLDHDYDDDYDEHYYDDDYDENGYYDYDEPPPMTFMGRLRNLQYRFYWWRWRHLQRCQHCGQRNVNCNCIPF